MAELTEAQQKYKKKVDLLSKLIKDNAITLEDALLLLEKDELEKPVNTVHYRGTQYGNLGMGTTTPNSILTVSTPNLQTGGPNLMKVDAGGKITFPISGTTYVPTSGATSTAFGSINYPTGTKPEEQETI
jgi:hypothetical protein